MSNSSNGGERKKVFRPYPIKDRVVARLYGLLAVTLIVPLVFLFIYIYTNYVERAAVSLDSTTALFWIGLGSSLLVLFPVLYAISSLTRSKVILTDEELTVINGYRRKTIRTEQIKAMGYSVFAKGVVAYRVSQLMPYEAGVITYEERGREHKLELPMGWYYLQDLVEELRTRLGERLAVDEASFERWQKWYRTPLLKKTLQVLLVMVALVLWLVPPVLVLVWISGRFNINLSDFEIWLFGGAGIMVYTWLLLLLIRGVDAARKALRKEK